MKRNSFNVGTVHEFSRQLAKEHGIPAALLLAFLAHRIPAVQAARKDQRGYFSSVKVMAKHYPYLTPSIISYALGQLREKGVLLTDVHNRKAYDRTLWYRFADPKTQQLAQEDPVRFTVEIAVEHGVEAALILANIDFWIKDNQKKDNRYLWHRVSTPKMAKVLPMSERTIRRVLDQLISKQVLDRKPVIGYDRAYLYCFHGARELERSISKFERSMSEIQRPDSKMDRSDSNFDRPNSATNTHYEEIIGNKSLEKTPLKKPVIDTLAAPMVVPFSQTQGFAGNEMGSKSRMDACGDDTEQPAATVIATPLAAPVSSKTRPPIHYGMSPSARTTADGYKRYEDRCEKFKSPYEALEKDASLTAEHKTRIFKQAVVSMRKIGRPEGSAGFKLTHSDKTFDTARRFFELNPETTVSDVIGTIDNCQFSSELSPKPDEGYDELFYERRVNNLDFFFKHLSKLGDWESGNFLWSCTFLDEVPENPNPELN